MTITDNDLIEKSNLNRQFLFRPHHIQVRWGVDPILKLFLKSLSWGWRGAFFPRFRRCACYFFASCDFPFVLFGHSDYFDFGFTTLSQSKCTFTEQVMKIPQHLSLESRKMSRTQWTLSGIFKAGCDVWKNEPPQCWFFKSSNYFFGITLFHWSCMEWECHGRKSNVVWKKMIL